MQENQLAGSRYAVLESSRYPYLQRARDCSLITIPSLVPPIGFTATSQLYTPYQSLGARGVNNLASKLLLTLLPPSSPFFRFEVDIKVKEQMQPGEPAIMDAALSKMEQAVSTEIEKRSIRVYSFEALKHLIVTGNSLLHIPKKGQVKVYPLTHYVTKRNSEGEVMEIIIKELISPDELPEPIQSQLEDDIANKTPDDSDSEEEVELYTWIRLGEPELNQNPKTFYIHQEVEGHILPGSTGEYPKDKLPWFPLRWIRISGEDYGRGYCEEYLGDLKSMEGLERSIVQAAAAASRIILLVNPNGVTAIEDVSTADNGSTIPGKKDDVVALTIDKMNDFKVCAGEIDRIEKRLSYAFLLNSAIQREGERVTAEEIRYMASELESTLGGVYSVMSVEFQLPLVQLILAQLQREGKLPSMPGNLVTPTIITGVDALGRSAEVSKLQQLLQMSMQALGPEVTAQRFNASEVLTRMGTGLGIDMKNLIVSDQAIQQQQQQAQQAALMQHSAPAGIKALSDNRIAAMNQNGGQPPQAPQGPPQ